MDNLYGIYELISSHGYKVYESIPIADNLWRLWSITDAKNGDIVYYECHGTKHLFIVKSVGETKDHVEGHFWYDITRNECEVWDGRLPYSNIASMCDAMPATKEQCDLLFQKMHEVGYKWDQKEKKLIKMKETKFKVGDWLQYRYSKPFLVEEITEQGYCSGNSCLPFEWEDEIHLWTIADAKDGDVLVASDGSIFLFAGVVDCACKYYVALTTDNHVEINKEAKGGYWETSRAVHPATKEQRDLLFQKMKEAGYEWDAEKKALIKTEPKMLDADKVIEWLDDNICNAYDYDGNEISTTLKSKFKKDFGLC